MESPNRKVCLFHCTEIRGWMAASHTFVFTPPCYKSCRVWSWTLSGHFQSRVLAAGSSPTELHSHVYISRPYFSSSCCLSCLSFFLFFFFSAGGKLLCTEVQIHTETTKGCTRCPSFYLIWFLTVRLTITISVTLLFSRISLFPYHHTSDLWWLQDGREIHHSYAQRM